MAGSRRTTSKRPAAKKPSVKRPARKAAVKKTSTPRAAAKKSPVKKAPAKRPAKKAQAPARRPALRAVQPGEAPEAPVTESVEEPERLEPLTLAEAVETGDPLTIALAQRRDIVRRLPETAGPALAALHRQLTLTTKEISSLEANAEPTGPSSQLGPVDDDSFDASAI